MTPQHLTARQFHDALAVHGAVPLHRLPIPRPTRADDPEPPQLPDPVDLDALLEGNTR